MVREQDRAFGAQRPGDDFTFFITHRHPRPTLQKSAVFVQRAEIHVRHLKRHFQHRQCGYVGRVSVDDAVHIRAGAVDPAVKAVGRVRHAVAFEYFQVFIDQQ